MSHSSGIPASEGLRNTFGSAISSRDKRLIKAEIREEQIVETFSANVTDKNWEQDLETVQPLLEKEKACYILYRLDTEGPSGYNWVLFCYVPDKAKVKEKMLYASSRSNLKQQLGLSYFSDEVFGTIPGDFNAKGFAFHTASKKMDAPLTEQEQIRQQESQRATGEIYSGGQSTYVHGVAFPVLQDAMEAMNQLVKGSVNYVQIVLDCDAEKIKLDHSAKLSSFAEFQNHVPTAEPRFHYFAYAHDFEGQNITSFVFVYSCPDGSKNTKSAPVRQRMLYSSSKANVSNILSSFKVNIAAKFEINAPDDLAIETIIETIHPKQVEKEKGFSKPSRPGKGGARMTSKTEKKP